MTVRGLKQTKKTNLILFPKWEAVISKQETIQSVFILFKTSFPTREDNILDQVYSNVKDSCKAAAQLHFRQSDHISVFLSPSYRLLSNISIYRHPASSK